MRAVITYHGGKSYWIGKHRFKLDVPLNVSDPNVIAHCQVTAGFSVDVTEAPAPVKKVREVVAKPPVAKKATKKKTSRRSYSDD